MDFTQAINLATELPGITADTAHPTLEHMTFWKQQHL